MKTLFGCLLALAVLAIQSNESHADSQFVDLSCKVTFKGPSYKYCTTPQSCTIRTVNQKFAHCDEHYRNFDNVILTVHGWNGDCANTFGKNKGSLFELLATKQFYDLDCFEYDSHNIDAKQLSIQLHKRLNLLNVWGYKRAFLVTHSTGGVLAVQVALDILNNDLPQGFKKPVLIDKIHAFATAINGVTKPISLAGPITQFFSPGVLRDLKPQSPYLKRLHNEMALFKTHFSNPPNTIDGLINQGVSKKLEIIFHHGQSDDWVVANITGQERWFTKDLHHLLQTRSGHSNNIGDNGKIGAPTYPSEFIDRSALVRLDANFRLDAFNAVKANRWELNTYDRQHVVLNGLGHYVDEKRHGAFKPLLALVKTLFVTKEVSRMISVDNAVIKLVVKALASKINHDPAILVNDFICPFVNSVLPLYDTKAEASLSTLGKGEKSAEELLIDAIEAIHNKVQSIHKAQSTSQYLCGEKFAYQSIDDFNNKVSKQLVSYLDSKHASVRGKAIALLSDTMQSYEDPNTIDTAISDSLFTFYSSRGYNSLNKAKKRQLTDSFVVLAQSEKNIAKLHQFATQPVNFSGISIPLFLTLNDNRMAEALQKNTDKLPLSAQITTLTSLINYDKDFELNRSALDPLLNKQNTPEENIDNISTLLTQTISSYNQSAYLTSLSDKSPTAQNGVLQAVAITKNVMDTFKPVASSDSTVAYKLDQFYITTSTVSGQFLSSKYSSPQANAIHLLADSVKNIQADNNLSDQTLKQLTNYYVGESNFIKINQLQKNKIAQTFEAFVKAPTSQPQVLQVLNVKVDYQGKKRPIWFTLNNQDLLDTLFEFADTLSEEDQITFYSDIIRQGGINSSDAVAVGQATTKLKSLIVEKPEQAQWPELLQELKLETPYQQTMKNAFGQKQLSDLIDNNP